MGNGLAFIDKLLPIIFFTECKIFQ